MIVLKIQPTPPTCVHCGESIAEHSRIGAYCPNERGDGWRDTTFDDLDEFNEEYEREGMEAEFDEEMGES